MEEIKVGDSVGVWIKDCCHECGNEHYVTRTHEKVVTKEDLICSDCIESAKHQKIIDIRDEEIQRLNGVIESMTDVIILCRPYIPFNSRLERMADRLTDFDRN